MLTTVESSLILSTPSLRNLVGSWQYLTVVIMWLVCGLLKGICNSTLFAHCTQILLLI